jgi:predicted type IV restriction endonuclease
MTDVLFGDWGAASERFDAIKSFVSEKDLVSANEAQTRFDVIDRMIREVLGWKHGQISVEEYTKGDEKEGFVDYLLRQGDSTIVVEAKKVGAAFPLPTQKLKLKLSGSVLGDGEIAKAISQAEQYARQKQAQVVVVTNGLCWCFYSLLNKMEDSYATLLFPFSVTGHGEQLFRFFAETNVENGSLSRVTNTLPPIEDRLITAIKYADARIDRNNVADFIAPALNNAFYADALLSNPDILKKCYITTDARIKYDTALGMHLSDPKSIAIKPAQRIKRGKGHEELKQIIETSISK